MMRYTTKFSQAKPNFSPQNRKKTKEIGLDFFELLWISLDFLPPNNQGFQWVANDKKRAKTAKVLADWASTISSV